MWTSSPSSSAASRARPFVEIANSGDDLLIVGAGRGALTRMRHGKVSRYCLARARCPVLAIPPASGREIGLDPARWALRHRELALDRALRDWERRRIAGSVR